MLSASLPPASCTMTRLRETAPAARAMSTRNAGAAKLIVNAAIPSRKNSRRVTFRDMSFSSDELVLAGSGDETREPWRLRIHLRVGAGPRAAGVQIRDQLAGLGRCKWSGSKPLQHGVEQGLGLRLVRGAERP